MKKLTFLACFICSAYVNAQSDPFFSHYMFNPAAYNPGWIGDVSTAFATFQHRSQWAGYTTTFDGNNGAPNSQLVSFVVPVQGIISSAGSIITLDQQGPERTVRLQAGAAYNISLNTGTVSIGVMPGLTSRRIQSNLLRTEINPDPLISGLSESQTKLDLTAGLFFKSFSGFFAGASVDHILSPSLIQVETDQTINGQVKPTYYFHGGKNLQLNRDLELTPTILMKSNVTGFSVDLSGVATFRDIMWGGLSYRRSEALILLVGYNFLENKELKVGYSFDYVVKDQDAKRPTSHEIFIRYDLPSLILGGRRAVKTPRFSF